MKANIYKKNFIHIILYISFLIIYFFSLEKFGMGDEKSRIRYYFLAFIVITSLCALFRRNFIYKSKKTFYNKELLFTIITASIFYIISYFKAKGMGYDLATRTYVQISLFLLPALLAFCYINIFNINEIINIMKITTIILIISYFLEPKHTLIEFLKIKNWLSINYFKSISFSESSIASEPFLQLFLFFNYFKNIKDEKINKKSLNFFSNLNFIFTILSFKRLAILFAILIIVLRRFINYGKKMSKKNSLILSFLFSLGTFLYTKFMKGEIFKNLNVFNLTSGRDYILSLWAKNNYISYGYGTSMLIINRYLEMDLVQIYMELNIFALFIFCYTFFRISNKNIYSTLIMIYTFLNMLTASSLPYSLGWILLLITVGCISSNKCKDEKVDITIPDYIKVYIKN